jgi:hypothetical protein
MISTREEWAAQFVKLGATLAQVNRELTDCGIQKSNPEEAKAVREEFTRQTLNKSNVAKRANVQYEGWVR